MTPWLSLISICLCVTVSLTQENYRQPYKFVAPYPLDIYTSPDTTPGDTTTNEPEIPEDEDESSGVGRIGEAAKADISLMSSSLNAPEPLPEAKSLVGNKSRSRKKVKEEEKKEEKKDLMENHKVEKDKLEPRAILNRQRIPPRPEDEYYYYYDDYYYDDYYPEKDPVRQEEKPVIPPTQSYPRKSPNTPKPPRTKETLKKETKPKKETSRPIKEKKPLKPENEKRKAGLNLEEREYNIQNTLNRLKGLKGNHVKKQGRPQTTLKKNPWEQFDLPPRKKPAPR